MRIAGKEFRQSAEIKWRATPRYQNVLGGRLRGFNQTRAIKVKNPKSATCVDVCLENRDYSKVIYMNGGEQLRSILVHVRRHSIAHQSASVEECS